MDYSLKLNSPMRIGRKGGWARNPKSEAKKSEQWLDPEFASRLEARHKFLRNLIEKECQNGNKYMQRMKAKHERETKRREKIHVEYMKHLETLNKPKKTQVPLDPIPSWILRWEPEQQKILWKKFLEYCNIGQSPEEVIELMTGARFFSFGRHCGFIDEVKTSKIIATIRAKARAARRERNMKMTPAEIVEKHKAYNGPGVTPATADILFTKVQRKNKHQRKVIDFDGFCECVERLALEVFRERPSECRRKAIEVISRVRNPSQFQRSSHMLCLVSVSDEGDSDWHAVDAEQIPR
uniref:Uncharacterized protein n=1 Tax=Lotharella globosa TaxID=91324 RepID=A0A6V3THE6_9EUKA